MEDKITPVERRIHYVDDEEFAGREASKSTRRFSNTSQLSVNSIGRTQTQVDPSLVLPIHYRTLSHQIDGGSKEAQAAAIRKVGDAAAAELDDLDWHTISVLELTQRLSTSLNQGLAVEQVKRKTQECGRNIPSPPPSRLLQKIFGYLFGGFGSILLVGSILVFVSWKPLGQPPAVANLALAIVLLIVFVIQALFNAWQDWSSSRVMASITTMLPENCLLLRDGVQVQVGASDVVPGDVLYIKAGDKLPADVRLVTISSDAKFDRSVLTGESKPVSGTVDSTDDNYLETHCIGMQGTHCISGSGIGVVVAIGDRTVFGRIATLTSRPSAGTTTLQKDLFRFVLIICSLMLSMIILVIIIWAGYLRKKHPDWISVPGLIVDCVSVAVAFIPEGLPIALTASLTITANLMRKNKILCKSLKTVETLGSVSVICSDKTGTLTNNQMFATECSIGVTQLTPESARDQMIRDQEKQLSLNPVAQLRAVAGLCNVGEFDAASIDLPLSKRKINGDATDQAVLRFSEGLGPVVQLRRSWKLIFSLAFNSKNKFMIRLHTTTESEGLSLALPPDEAASFGDEDMLLTIKGAPDVLLGRCTHCTVLDGVARPLDTQMHKIIEDIKNEWSRQGKRVILLARKILSGQEVRAVPGSNEMEKEAMDQARFDLTLVGLIGIADPPRAEIPDVVRTLRRAGIRIFMVTGDFKLTAQAIAEDCGIISNIPALVDDFSALPREGITKTDDLQFKIARTEPPFTSIVLSGPEILSLNDKQWEQVCRYDEIVFARTTPEQKLRIVKEFQARDNIVAMTGDGVNDAPSLKAADIGIALGSGSDIAIEAADMVLLDSFSAIVEAVQYGRVVYDNLKKTIAYLLPAGSFSEFWPIMTKVIFGLPQILSSFLMIIICCFTDCAAATMLAYEKPEADVLLRPPRNPKKDRLVDWRLTLQAYGFLGVSESIASFSMAYWYAERRGVTFNSLWFGYGNLSPGLTKDQISHTLNEASSIYFVNLVVMQWFNLMAIRTRHLSIFQHPPAFNKATQNLSLFPAILFALLIVFFFCYIPPLQNVLSTTSIPVEYFFFPMAFGLMILFLDEARKWGVRKWPNGVLAKCAW